ATLVAGADLRVEAAAVQATGATATAGGNVRVRGSLIRGGLWSGQGDVTATAQGALDLTGGGLVAAGEVSASGQGITTNNAMVSGRLVSLDAGSAALSNVGGVIQASGTSGDVLAIAAK